MKKLILILAFILLIMPIGLVYASDDESVNLGDVPQKLADALGVSLFVGQLLASLILMSLFLFPSMLIAGYFGGQGAVLYTIIIVGLASSGVCMAMGWFPTWLYAIMCLVLAVMYATKFTGMLGGGKEG